MKFVNYKKDLICINLKSLGQREIFMICEEYTINFESIYSYKVNGCNKIWIHLPTTCTFVTEKDNMLKFSSFLKDYELSGPTKKEYEYLRGLKPVNIPKVKKTSRCIDSYLYYLEKGFDIRMTSLDRYIEAKKNSILEKNDTIDDIDKLIDIALDKKDFVEVERLCKYKYKTK